MEYAVRDDDEKRNGHSPDRRGRDMSPDGRGYDHGRSPSPYRRDRASPDYGHGSSRLEARGSPKYDRVESPINGRYDRFIFLIYLFFCVLVLAIQPCIDTYIYGT